MQITGGKRLHLQRNFLNDHSYKVLSGYGPASVTYPLWGCGSGGYLCEVNGGAPVNLRYGIGVVPPRGGPAAACSWSCGRQ